MTAPPPEDEPGERSGTPDPSRSWRAHSTVSTGTGVLHDAYTQFRTFERAREGRMVAGVCAGVGRRLGIDPVVIRVVIAVLALVSGAGLVLYGAGWLLLPEQGRDRSLAQRMLGRHGDESNGAIVVGVGAIVALVAMGMLPWGQDWWGPVLVIGIIAGLVALARRRPDDAAADPLHYLNGPSGTPASATPAWTANPGTSGTSAAPAESTAAATGPIGATEASGSLEQTGFANFAQPTSAAATTDRTGTAADPTPARSSAESGSDQARPADGTPGAPPRTWTQHAATPPPPSFWDQPDPLGLESEPAPAEYVPAPASPAPAKVARPRSLLFPLTVGAALLSLFVLAAASGAGEQVPLAFWAAAPLGVIGLGLLVGTWYGRVGGLIALGIPLAIAVIPLGVVDAVAKGGSWPQGNSDIGDASYAPASVAEIRPIYRHGAGEFTLDLTEVEFAGRDPVRVNVEAGVGDVTVIVPEEVDVSAIGSVGLGDATVLGESIANEPSQRFDLRDNGTDGAGGGRLTLHTSLGMGSLQIDRAAPTRPPEPESPSRVEQPERPR